MIIFLAYNFAQFGVIPYLALFQGIRQLAVYIGMPMHELENLISWRVKPLDHIEKEIFTLQIETNTEYPYYESSREANTDRSQHMWLQYRGGVANIPFQKSQVDKNIGTFQIPVDSLLTQTQRYARFHQTNCSLLLPSRERCLF